MISDSELLDWVEKNHYTITRECDYGHCQWVVYWEYLNFYDIPQRRIKGVGKTLREAIEASMSK